LIGLDTNVLIRYLVQDDKAQAVKATKLIEGKLTKDVPGFINHITLVEIVWVLESCYDVSKQEIINVIEQLCATKQLFVQEVEVVLKALRVYQSNNTDFSDALIGCINKVLGCGVTYTYDKKTAKLELFEGL